MPRQRNLYANWNGLKVVPYNLPQPMPGIYLITNLVNGKNYIGRSVNVRQRATAWSAKQYNEKGALLGEAIRLFGLENFLFRPILYALDTSILGQHEVPLMIEWDSLTPFGYNDVGASEGADILKLIQARGVIAARHAIKNSVWITNGRSNRRWQKDQPLPRRWRLGRTLKNPTGPKPGVLTWIHNGVIERQFLQGQAIPEGWQRGRLPGKIGRKKGTVAPFVWITDGVDQQQHTPGTKMPAGWRLGRLPKSSDQIEKQRTSLTKFYQEHPEVREKISATVRERFADPEFLERFEAGRVRAGPKIAAGLKAFYASEEGQALLAGKSERISAQMLKQWGESPLIWITDGSVDKRIASDQPIPIGWYRGRAKGKLGRRHNSERSS